MPDQTHVLPPTPPVGPEPQARTGEGPAASAPAEPRTGSRTVPAARRLGRGSVRPATWRAVVTYCLLAYGLAWLVGLPLWLGGGLTSPLLLPVALVMMTTPTVAALVVVRWVERGPVVATLGLRPAGARRTLGWLVVAVAVTLAAVVVGLLVSAALGWFRFDLVGMSGFRETVAAQLAAAGAPADSLPPLRVLWVVQLVTIPAASFVNAVPALGEELGWRGYLFPRLRELVGPGWAVMLSGAIWGTWHAPLLLLGYNYPSNPPLGVLMMSVGCIGIGALFSWLVERGGSVWPAAVAHGAYNAAAGGLLVALGAADHEVDTVFATAGGIAGWPMWLALVVALLASRALGVAGPAPRSGG